MMQPHPSGRAAAAFALALALMTAQALADGPQPAQKDSNARAKPKDAELTATIEPAEARPGDVVQLKVHAKLKPGWHIYTFAEQQREDGPRHTLFDPFDLAGLEKDGTWTASKKPEARAEPAFENKTFEFFEDEVSWSLPLKIPADAAPGEKTVRVQASYQLCNASSCSFPGRWTLPDAVVTVVAGKAAPAAPPRAAPRKKDSSARLRPPGVSLTPTVTPAVAKPGDAVTYRVAVKLNPGLHIYDLEKPGTNDNGPVWTVFDLFDAGGLQPSGTWKASHDPTVKPEPAFGPNVVVEFFEDEVEIGRAHV